MRTRLPVAFLAALLFAALARAQAGPEFQVNGFTTSYQYGTAVASVGASSNFVVVWSSNGEDGDKTGLVGRLFDSAGAPLGGDFQVNVSTTGYQGFASVASNPGGDFVVTWTEYVSAVEPSFEIRARRFDSAGEPEGGEILVNTYTTGAQAHSAVALDVGANFVVVWQSGAQDGSSFGIFGQRFNAAGVPLGGEFQVNEYTTSYQTRPRIAMNLGGDFIVVWQSEQDAQLGAVMARRYDSNGAPIAGEFQVNTTELGAQYTPDVALDPAGKAIVVWTSYAQDGAGGSIVAQRLDASGNKLGPEFNVNTFTTGFQGRARVAAGLGDPGEFTIIWQGGANEDGDDFGVFLRRYDATGRGQSFETPVATFTTGFQGNPAIAAQPNGQFVAAWESFGNDGSDYGIAGRVGGAPRPDAAKVDAAHDVAGGATPSGASNLNGVLEVGEQVVVEPAYRNFTSQSLPLTGVASNFRGPAGLTYGIPDATADYGTIGSGGGIADCLQATGDCYQFSLSGTRPPGHVDTAYDETLSYNGFVRTELLHVGGSFADVSSTSLFYPFVENLFHNGITGGCAGGGYCPTNNVTRAQMAVFLLKSRWGAGFLPAPATGTAFPDVPASNPFARWIEELAREGVTGGCGGGLYCPDNPVTRQQMAVFLLKMLNGSTYVPPACSGQFDDVPCPSQFADWIEDLAGRGITGGCSGAPPLYCPLGSVLRQQMAAFLVKTFGLLLYGG